MNSDYKASPVEVDIFLKRLKKETSDAGYCLNPDEDFVRELIAGIMLNELRYGYPSCPCRLASDDKNADLDIICPCDYRDSDLAEYGVCYCALYVSEDVMKGHKGLSSIPERRPSLALRTGHQGGATPQANSRSLSYPVWRCKVCGYLCARNEPPEACPICKAKKERFERFM